MPTVVSIVSSFLGFASAGSAFSLETFSHLRSFPLRLILTPCCVMCVTLSNERCLLPLCWTRVSLSTAYMSNPSHIEITLEQTEGAVKKVNTEEEAPKKKTVSKKKQARERAKSGMTGGD